MKLGRILTIVAATALLALIPEDKLGFLAGLVVGLCVGAVGALFAMSEGVREEDEGKTCKECGR